MAYPRYKTAHFSSVVLVIHHWWLLIKIKMVGSRDHLHHHTRKSVIRILHSPIYSIRKAGAAEKLELVA